MCDICNMGHCPPGCPSYENEAGLGLSVGRCVLCDEVLCEGDRVLEKNGELLCENCVDVATLEDVLAAEGVRDAAELLCDCLGWRWRNC